MSKISMDRPRYVAFRIVGPEPVSRRAAGQAILAAARGEGWPADAAPQLTRYAFPHGIVRVSHEHLAAVRRLLPAVAAMGGATVRVETLGTSGTLLALTSRLGVLSQRGEPEGAAPQSPRPAQAPVGAAAGPAGAGAPQGRGARSSTPRGPTSRP